MGLFASLFARTPASPFVTRSPGGAAVIDLRKAPAARVVDGTALDGLEAVLDQGTVPRLRAFVLPAPALLAWSQSPAAMAERVRALFVATRRVDAKGQGVADVAFIAGPLDGIAAALTILWSLGLTPLATREDGTLPIVETGSSCGVTGTPLGRPPADQLLRTVNQAHDFLEKKAAAAIGADQAEAHARVVATMLDLAANELDYITELLRAG